MVVHPLYDAAKTPDWATEGHPQQRRHFRPLLALQGARAAAFLPPASAAASQPPTCPPWTQQPCRGLVRTAAQLNQCCVVYLGEHQRQPDQWPTSGREAAYIQLSMEYSVVQQQTPSSVDHLTCLVSSAPISCQYYYTINMLPSQIRDAIYRYTPPLYSVWRSIHITLRFSGLGTTRHMVLIHWAYPMQCLHEHLHRSNKIKNLKKSHLFELLGYLIKHTCAVSMSNLRGPPIHSLPRRCHHLHLHFHHHHHRDFRCCWSC